MFRSVSKHLVIGMNNFYFYSTFSRFILNQVFLAFRRVSLKTHSCRINYFSFSYYFSKFIFIQVYFMFRSVSKHLVIGMNNFYFYSTFSRFILNQVFLAFRRVSLKTHSCWDKLFFFFLLLQ